MKGVRVFESRDELIEDTFRMVVSIHSSLCSELLDNLLDSSELNNFLTLLSEKDSSTQYKFTFFPNSHQPFYISNNDYP